MQWQGLLSFAPLLAMLTCAAVIDLRSRRIPNWLTLMIAMTGTMQSLLPSATVTPLQSACGMAVGVALTFVLFAIGAVGGGDVKLLAATGTWVGPVAVFYIFIVEKVVGMVIVLCQCAHQRRLPSLFRNTAVVAVNLANVQHLGTAHVEATGSACRSIDKPLPYAVPVLLAVVFVLARRGLV